MYYHGRFCNYQKRKDGHGVFFTSTKSTEATTPGVNVLEWLKDYFSFEKGGSGKKADDVLFAEEQIGFIPEGFELKEKEVIMQIMEIMENIIYER